MPIIQTIPPHEALKIAAGEVVERPASVVKELLENALDAGATALTIIIEDAGKKLIKCIDNGSGMDPEDARACIGVHATSKLRVLDDLQTMSTFGFRGEALAALAASSRLTITTKDAASQHGTRLAIEQGIILSQELVATQTGTVIEAQDLFYAMPARQKFLKKSATEARHIKQLFDALMLMQPSVHAKLMIDGSMHAHYPSVTTTVARIEQIVGEGSMLLPVLYTAAQGVRISGAVGDHQLWRYDRNDIYICVNKRWVKNQGLSRAVMRAYTVLPTGRFPVACIHIELDPALVDVNVHPRKEEVQFAHPYLVETAITNAIKAVLELPLTNETHQPIIKTVHHTNAQFTSAQSAPPLWHTAYTQPSMPTHDIQQHTVSVSAHELSTYGSPLFTPASNEKSIVSEICNSAQMPILADTLDDIQKSDVYRGTVIGQLLLTYILVEIDDALLLVDQHAAHERILYERFATRFESVPTVSLLFPELVSVSALERTLVEPYFDLLAQHGIIVDIFGQEQLRVTAIPVYAKSVALRDVIQPLIALIRAQETSDGSGIQEVLSHELRAMMACKAAVKAGDQLSREHMHELLNDLEKTPNRLTCPHGRPTCWVITHKELEKKFQRSN